MKRAIAYVTCILCATLLTCTGVADQETDDLSEKVKEEYNDKDPGSAPCVVGQCGQEQPPTPTNDGFTFTCW